MHLRVSVLAAVVLGAGCVIGEEEIDEPGTSVDEQGLGGGGCDEFQCGTNSPQIAQYGFWDLHMPPSLAALGLPNNVGIQVRSFVKWGVPLVPRVVRGRLFATGTLPWAPFPTITLSGNYLVDGAFELVRGGRTFLLRVTEVNQVQSWAQPVTRGAPVMLESYKLDWTEITDGPNGRFVNVCNNPPSRESPELLTMVGLQTQFHTLLFEGDRILAAEKRVVDVDPAWVNLGCAGSALAKMALTGHTEASTNARTFITTLPERQAMLKMLTGDYCGDGKPFTVGGQPLNWRDDRNTMKLTALSMTPPAPLVLESRWTDEGAACLDKPRVDVHWTQAGEDEFDTTVSSVYSQVQSHCPLEMPPPCTDSSFNTAGYHLLSATVPYDP